MFRLETKTADGSGEAVILVEGGMSYPAWSADGRVLVYGANRGIDYLEIQADGSASAPITFLSTPAGEDLPQLSPNGRFLAYVSDESGRTEVYVRPFPSGAGKWQVSVDGGTAPRWRGDGAELFYRNDDVLMAAPVTLQPTFSLGLPQKLFDSQDLVQGASRRNYDVSADGQRFLTIAPFVDEDASPPSIRVVQNWYEEFRGREQD